MDASDPVRPLKKTLVARGPSTYGATSVVKQAQRGRGSHWLIALLRRTSPKHAAVALANKTARIAWKLMVTGESYDGALMPKASVAAAA